MGGLFSGGQAQNWENPSVTPYYTGLQIQTSSTNVPIPIVYGANKIAPNCIWTGGFYGYYGYPEWGSEPTTAPQGGKGGVFGGGGKSTSQQNAWQYYTSWMMGLCEGPIAGFGTIWANNSATNIYGGDIWGWSFGYSGQPPWWFLYNFGGQAIGYSGTAWIASYNYYLGNQANLPQFSIEIFGRLYTSSGINGGDADPAQIVQDFLTNAQYGVGFPAASIDSTTLLSPASGPDSSYQGYCRAAYLALSPALTNQEQASSILTRWMKLTNTAAVWSGGKLKFIPYGDEILGPTPNRWFSGGVTFTPNLTAAYSLTDDAYIHEDGEDPVQVERLDPYECYNWQRLQINERIASWLPLNVDQPWVLWQWENSYEPWPVDVWDQNAIELYGLRMASDITANEICDPGVAQISAQLILQRGLYVRNTYKFKLSWEYCLLDPMDLVEITDPGLGLSNFLVRITEIEEDDDGTLAITAEEFVAGVGTASQYQTQGANPNSIGQSSIPARVATPVIFEPPASLTNNIAQLFIAASGSVGNVYKLTETAVTAQHFTGQPCSVLGISAPSSPAVLTMTFSVYVQAVERSAVRLNIFNGSAQVGADFDLSGTIPVAYPDSGVIATAIPAEEGSSWMQLTVSTPLIGSNVIPYVYIYLETKTGSTFNSSYAGTAGDGVYIWGQNFGWGITGESNPPGAPQTDLPAFSTVSGAAIAVNNSVANPESVTSGQLDPNWGGANIWVSTDNISYSFIGQLLGASTIGALTASITSSGSPLSVSLDECNGTLSSASATNVAAGANLCFVGGALSPPEILSFETATLTGPSSYDFNLTNLTRGEYGTSAMAHSSGDPFVLLNGSVFQYQLPASLIGKTIYIKLQSFNTFQSMWEDMENVAAYTYVPTGAGSPVGPVTQALQLGQNLDFGLVSAAVSESDQWGIVSDRTIAAAVDLGAGI